MIGSVNFLASSEAIYAILKFIFETILSNLLKGEIPGWYTRYQNRRNNRQRLAKLINDQLMNLTAKSKELGQASVLSKLKLKAGTELAT